MGMPIDDLKAAADLIHLLASRADTHDGVAPLWHGWALREAYLKGVAAEREACARVLDAMAEQRLHLHEANQQSDLMQAAEAIRARGTEGIKP